MNSEADLLEEEITALQELIEQNDHCEEVVVDLRERLANFESRLHELQSEPLD